MTRVDEGATVSFTAEQKADVVQRGAPQARTKTPW